MARTSKKKLIAVLVCNRIQTRYTNLLLVISLTERKAHYQSMETLEDPLLKEIMARFKENSRAVTKDLLSGIGMFDMASRLILYIAILIATYTLVFVWIGYYQVGYLYGQLGTAVSFAAIVMLGIMWLRFRRRYSALKLKYASLFELFDKLGAN